MKEVFSCKRCGFCCHGETTVSLNEQDQQRMLDTLNITRDEAFARYWTKTKGEVQMKVNDGHCIFFDQGCSVHEGRPWRCRQWPLVPAIIHDRLNLTSIQQSCPGINRSAKYEDICEAIRKVNKELNDGS